MSPFVFSTIFCPKEKAFCHRAEKHLIKDILKEAFKMYLDLNDNSLIDKAAGETEGITFD